MNESETVLVTGAGGFVGGRVVERMQLESSTPSVVAGVHDLANCARIGRFPVDIEEVDVLFQSEVDEAVADVDAIVHCAYGDREVNVTGTENVLSAAAEHNVDRVVFMSTVEVYDEQSGVLDETARTDYSGDEYADSKLDAEGVCQEYMSDELSVTILRPAIIYGPFSANWTINPVRRLQSGLWGNVPGLGGTCNPIFIDDLVTLIQMSLTEPAARNETFNAVGPERVTWNEFFQRLNHHLERPELRYMPLFGLYAWASVMYPFRCAGQRAMENHEEKVRDVTTKSRWLKRMARTLRDRITESPTFDELSLYRRKITYSTDKVVDELGYSPEYELEEGLAQSAAWLEHHGFVNRKPV